VALSVAVKNIRLLILGKSGGTNKIGAIYMAENASSGVQTRHIYTRYHLMYVEHV
jgi:hypothetical protein